MPPSFFDRAMSLPPKMMEFTSWSKDPASIMVKKIYKCLLDAVICGSSQEVPDMLWGIIIIIILLSFSIVMKPKTVIYVSNLSWTLKKY